MRKKKLHIISTVIGLFFCLKAKAQINISLPAANIISRADYSVQLGTGTYTTAIGLFPNVQGEATSSLFTNALNSALTVPLNALYFKLISIGGVSLIAATAEVNLSTTFQSTYAALATVGSGAVIMNYRLAVSGQTWQAGTYTAPFSLRTSATTNNISPASQNINITVPSFITPQSSIGPTQIHINSLNYYTGTAPSATQSITLSSTIASQMTVHTTGTQFSFTSTNTYSSLPTTNVSLVSAVLSGVTGATAINLSGTNQALCPALGLTVPTTNTTTLSLVYSITNANLLSGFVKAGTYTIPVVYTWANSPTSSSVTSELDVLVDQMSNITVNQASVSLTFATKTAYTSGVITQVSNHISLSDTSPYDLYVKASGAYLTSGSNQIPVSIITVEPMTGQTGVSTVTLSSASQRIIAAADPAVNRQLNIQYHIPSSVVAASLLGKHAGTYSTSITYSFVAL